MILNELDHFLHKKGSECVNLVQQKILEEHAWVTGNFYRSVNYQVVEDMEYSSILIDWIFYGKYADAYHGYVFTDVIEHEVDSLEFENQLLDAIDMDVQGMLDNNIKNNYIK